MGTETVKDTELHIIENYACVYPQLRGQELTDALVIRILKESRYAESAGIPVGCGDGKPGGSRNKDDGGESGGSREPSAMRILRLPEGKPVLAGDRGIYFSVSHTGSVFACAVADAEIGLDIQEARRRDEDKTWRLARRYFTENEIAYLEAGDLTDRFYRLWTRKEAYAKYTGAGLKAVLAKEPVLVREDVVFTEMLLGDGLYGCICRGAE